MLRSRRSKAIQPARVYKIPDNPTAENMARYLLHQVGPKLLAELRDYDLVLYKVVLCESEKSAAIVELFLAVRHDPVLLRHL